MKTYQSPLFYYAIATFCFSFLFLMRSVYMPMEGAEMVCIISFIILSILPVVLFWVDVNIRQWRVRKSIKWGLQVSIVVLSVVFMVDKVIPVLNNI